MTTIRYRQTFLEGPRTKIKNCLNFLHVCGGLFFVVEPLKTVQTAKNRKFCENFPKKPQIFEKEAPKIFRLRWDFF